MFIIHANIHNNFIMVHWFMFYVFFSISSHISEDDTLPALTQALIPASQGCTVGDLQSHPVCVIQNLARHLSCTWAPHEAWDCGYMCNLSKGIRYDPYFDGLYHPLTNINQIPFPGPSNSQKYKVVHWMMKWSTFRSWWATCMPYTWGCAVESLCWSQRSENCINCSGVFQMQKSARTAVSK